MSGETLLNGKPPPLAVFIHLFFSFTVTGKQRPKSKTSKPDQHGSKDGNDGGAKILAEKPTAKMKKSAKLPSSTNAGQEEPVSDVKKKPTTGLSSAKPKKQDEDRSALKNKNRAKEQEHMAEVQNHTERPPHRAEQPELQSTSTGREMMIIFSRFVFV